MAQTETKLKAGQGGINDSWHRWYTRGAALMRSAARALPLRAMLGVLWALTLAAALLALAASIPLGYALLFRGVPVGPPVDAPAWYVAAMGFAYGVASLLAALLSLGLGVLLYWKRRDEPMAVLGSFYLLAYGIVMAGPLEALNGFRALVPPSAPQYAGLLIPNDVVWYIQNALTTTPLVLFLYLFPNGRFAPGWTRWAGYLLIALTPAMIFVDWNRVFNSTNPFNVALVSIYLGLMATGLYAQFYRYRHLATATERQQVKWVVWGMALTIVPMAILFIPYSIVSNLPVGTTVPAFVSVLQLGWWLTISILPVCLSVAVMRYHLWDIDIIFNRALVYGALTASVVAVYVLASAMLGVLGRADANLLDSLLATAAVAVLFQPLRERLQRGVNRLMYGERDDPYAVISRLGTRLEATLAPDAVLPTIVETVAQALKLPYAAIQLADSARAPGDDLPLAASYGQPQGELLTLPLVYQSERIGQLLLAPRAPGEAFSAADRQLLAHIAQQAGVAAHTVRLTADLQHSRERLVTAREEERRRLRRDLHDGLGPALAAQTLKAGSARALYARDPAAADALLAEMERDSEAALADIRRLVYNLRPPALDELGLVGAIRAHAAQYRGSALSIRVEAPELPPLPAAVEVAAYRIVQEALANVIRHAGAHACQIQLALDEALHVTVTDDGAGIAGTHPAGVGLASMRERAAELGGTCVVEAGPQGGTQVRARLPLGVRA